MDPDRPLMPQVAVIGGGIAGLAAAYTLQQNAKAAGISLKIALFESSAQLGGKILTDSVDGLTVEGGPDSFLLQKPWAAQLAQSLGLEAELMGTNPERKKLFVINRGRLTPMPDGVMLIIPTRFMPFVTSPLISLPGKLRMGMDFFIPRIQGEEDESIGAFIRRRLGSEALEKIAEPLLSGIHVSDPEYQSLLGTFPRFRALEKKHGSLIRGMLAQRKAARANGHTPPQKGSWKSSVFVSLRGGMARLVDALQQALADVQLRTGCAVTGLQPRAGGGYRLTTAGSETWEADAVVFATPAFVTAGLVAPLAPELERALGTIRYVSTATVSLAFRDSDWGDALPGVGFIIPRKENRKISACTMTSIKFAHRAPAGQVLLRCFVGGPGREEALEREDGEIIADARAELADLVGVRAAPIFARVYRWPQGNAQYDVGHLERVKAMHGLCPAGLFLTGSAYEGIGIPDCVHQGQLAAEKVLEYLQKDQRGCSCFA